MMYPDHKASNGKNAPKTKKNAAKHQVNLVNKIPLLSVFKESIKRSSALAPIFEIFFRDAPSANR